MEKEEKKFTASNIFEGMTSISAVINAGNGRSIEKIWIDRAKQKSKAQEISFLRAKSKELGYTIEFVESKELDDITVGTTHGGIIAFCTDRILPSLTSDVIKKDGFYVFLEGIEDPYNFGYALRSIYAAGADGIILPERNWLTAAGVVARASAGASELLNLYTSAPDDAAIFFKNNNYRVICADKPNSVSLYDADLRKPVFLIVGGEKRGIRASVLKQADEIVRIEYGRDFAASLSAASASTIIAYEIYRQNR